MGQLPPDFNAVVLSILKVLGLNAGVILLVGLAFVAQGWYEGIKSTGRAIRQVSTTARAIGEALRRPPRAAREVVALDLAIIAVLSAQAILLGLSLLVGSIISMLTDLHRQGNTNRLRTAVEAVAQDPWYGLGSLSHFLVVDVVSASYVLICLFVMLRSYRKAFEPGWLKVAANASAFPVVIAVSPVLPLAIVGERAGGTPDLGTALIAFCVVPLLLWTGYFTAWHVALRGSKVVVRSWNLLLRN